MKVYKTVKPVGAGTEFEMEHNKALIITGIGTDDTARSEFRIDGKTVGYYTKYVAPERRTEAYWYPPLSLGKNYLVIPPEYSFYWAGTSGTYLFLFGKLIVLEAGEVLPGEHLTRFKEQHNKYVDTVLGATVGTGVNWGAGAEITLYSRTLEAHERMYLNNRFMVDKITFGSPVEVFGDIGVRFYIEDTPLDWLLDATGKKGISRPIVERCESDTRQQEEFTFEDVPIEVLPNQTIEIRLMNVSGGTLFTTSQAEFSVKFAFEYRKFE